MKPSAYIKVVLVVGIHGVLSWIILAIAGQVKDPIFAFTFPILWGVLSGVVFLYFFLHDKSFKMARDMERQEKKMEDKWLKRFSHSGKLFTVLAIGTICGPIFGALTIRLIMPKYKYKYWLVSLINFPSTVFYFYVVKFALDALLKR